MTRLVAGVIDVVVCGLISVIGYFSLVFALFLVKPHTFELPRPGFFLSLTSGMLVGFVYLTIAWFLSGRTYGDLVMGVRVLGRGGGTPGLLEAAARALLMVVAPIGILWVPLGRTNQSIQDVFLRTQVVYDWRPRQDLDPLR